jgi:hypothetical protein
MDAGKSVGIGYDAKGKASINLALKLVKGRVR